MTSVVSTTLALRCLAGMQKHGPFLGCSAYPSLLLFPGLVNHVLSTTEGSRVDLSCLWSADGYQKGETWHFIGCTNYRFASLESQMRLCHLMCLAHLQNMLAVWLVTFSNYGEMWL